MYGMALCFFEGRITRDIKLRESEDGRKYCYFSIAVNPRPYTDRETGKKVERDAEFFNLSASGGTAATLAKYGKKGTLFCGLTKPQNKEREVVKDGVKTVYREVIFVVEPNKFDIDKDKAERETDTNAPAPAEPDNGPGAASAAPQYEQAEDDSEDDGGLASSLPF